MFPGFSPIPHGFTSMHQQRMDGFCTLANGMRCGVIIRDRRLIIMAGEHQFDLTNILQHCACLGVRWKKVEELCHRRVLESARDTQTAVRGPAAGAHAA